MAETRRSSSPDSLFVSPDHHYNNTHAARRHTPLALPPTARHYPGDGLDFRRPTTTAAGMGGSTAVIDLTLEDDSRSVRVAPEASPLSTAGTPEPGPSRTRQRLPNFNHRNIIDVESDAEREEADSRGGRSDPNTRRQHQPQHQYFPQTHHPHPHRAAENMDRRSTDPTRAPPARLLRPWEIDAAPRSITPHPTGPNARGNTTIDLTADDDDDVVFTEARPRNPPQPLGRPEATAGIGTRSVIDRVYSYGGRATVGIGLAMGAGGVLDRVIRLTGGGARPHVIPPHAPGAAPTIDMNYLAVGFAMGPDAARPPTPKYEPPPPAETGFTRSPGEGDELVCPNCGDELCMGSNEVKQQVWVIKTCGHVSQPSHDVFCVILCAD